MESIIGPQRCDQYISNKIYEFDGKIAIVLCEIVLEQINMYVEKNLILTLYIMACKKTITGDRS